MLFEGGESRLASSHCEGEGGLTGRGFLLVSDKGGCNRDISASCEVVHLRRGDYTKHVAKPRDPAYL